MSPWRPAVSDTETRDEPDLRLNLRVVRRQRDEAWVELKRQDEELRALRGVAEAVRAIHVRDGGWCAACNDMAPCQTARVLASVPSSGEAESARDLRRVMASSGETEPHPQFTAFRERALANPETRAAYEEAMAHDAATRPVLSREAVADLLLAHHGEWDNATGHIECDCGWAGPMGSGAHAFHLADVLAAVLDCCGGCRCEVAR
jgi:hypothetical protein